MKKSELLRLAKAWLRTADEVGHINDKEAYICWAVGAVRGAPMTLKRRVRLDISALLSPRCTASRWLNDKRIYPTSQELQTYRHLWVDHMIAQYEAKGE